MTTNNVSVHLMFAGECASAFRFYEGCLGGRLTMLTYGNSPMAEQVPPDWRDKIVHATLTVGQTAFAGADVLPDQHERPRGFYMLLDVGNPSDVESVFRSFAEEGVVQVPLGKTFWSASFGVVTDRFGITWEINCAQPADPDRIVMQA